MSGPYGQVNFYRIGSGAHVLLGIETSLAATLSAGGVNAGTYVSWDFNNQIIAPYETTATYSITSMTWSATNGGQAVVVAAVATPVAAVGDIVTISGATNSGTGGASLVNGNFTVTAFTNSQNFTIAMPGTSTAIGTIGGTILANYGTGILPVEILDVQVGNSMTIQYNPLTGVATWNRSGSVARVLI